MKKRWIFEKNILRNFTLSNVMNNLTILNPDKLLEHVAKSNVPSTEYLT